jgi:hypothetical protein
MEQLFPVLFVVALIAFIMMKQIGHITGNLDVVGETNDFDKYSKFSVAIQNHIRAIKLDIDSTKQIENPRYVLKDTQSEEDFIEELSDYLRKLVFFETLLAKKKTTSEIESELFSILSQLDEFLRQNCVDGDVLADELRDNLLQEYENY